MFYSTLFTGAIDEMVEGHFLRMYDYRLVHYHLL